MVSKGHSVEYINAEEKMNKRYARGSSNNEWLKRQANIVATGAIEAIHASASLDDILVCSRN